MSDGDDTTNDRGDISLDRRGLLKAAGVTTGLAGLGAITGSANIEPAANSDSVLQQTLSTLTSNSGPDLAYRTLPSDVDPYSPGLVDPVRTKISEDVTRKLNTDQVTGLGELEQKVGFRTRSAKGVENVAGNKIEQVSNPYDDLAAALGRLVDATADGKAPAAEAEEIEQILKGETDDGRIYDGFSMLNYNQPDFPSDGYNPDEEYKMKELEDRGNTATSPITGNERTVWEVDVNMFWYGQQFESDCFTLRVPKDVDPLLDPIRIHYHVYSLVAEELAPTSLTRDSSKGPLHFPFKGLDSVWTLCPAESVTEVTVDHPPPALMTGIYIWGWRVHPPRIQFLQPVTENENGELTPKGRSFAARNRQLSIEGIGDAAPEKKMLTVARAIIDGTESPSTIHAWLTDSDAGPRGTWQEWVDLGRDQRQLPPEAWDELDVSKEQGLEQSNYRFVVAYVNNEMYGLGPWHPSVVEAWEQGERFKTKVINLDNHTHYYRVVDFGPRLNNDMKLTQGSGGHSFEMFDVKPVYGVPKAAEVQWRAGWGFRPKLGVIQQYDVFPRHCDQNELVAYTDGRGDELEGYLFSEAQRGGTWRFDPPPKLTGGTERLFDDGESGLRIGTTTEGFGHASIPNPNDLGFPSFLQNPDGGDVIPPTPKWRWLWYLHPEANTLEHPSDEVGYWVDKTYAHGRPVPAKGSITATIEQPREAGQGFYQFDPLFHDTAIYTPHPLSREEFKQEQIQDRAEQTVVEEEANPHGAALDRLFTAKDQSPVSEGRRSRDEFASVDADLSVELRHDGCGDDG